MTIKDFMNDGQKELLEKRLTLREILGYCSAKILLGEEEVYFSDYRTELRQLLLNTDDNKYFVYILRERNIK